MKGKQSSRRRIIPIEVDLSPWHDDSPASRIEFRPRRQDWDSAPPRRLQRLQVDSLYLIQRRVHTQEKAPCVAKRRQAVNFKAIKLKPLEFSELVKRETERRKDIKVRLKPTRSPSQEWALQAKRLTERIKLSVSSQHQRL